jgi:uncharacterized membrane protein YdjX (TVP38/TMEM64 family)
VPLIPYRVLDISFGLSRFSLKKYLLVVIIASPPRIFIIQFVLAAIKSMSVEKIVEYFSANSFIALVFFIYFIFAAGIIFLIRKKLQ